MAVVAGKKRETAQRRLSLSYEVSFFEYYVNLNPRL